MKQDMTTRLLSERDHERDCSDLLAVSVQRFLTSKDPDFEALEKALVKYCIDVGYNGPACSWAKLLSEGKIRR